MAIREFDYIVLKKDANWKNFQIIKKKQIWMCKSKFVLDGVIGHRFGSSFKIQDGQLVKLDASHLDDDDNFETDEAVLDNRDLVDDCESQKMSKEELHTMHKQGCTGDEIVEHLVKNSSTFSKKTEFAQQKYIKKKRKKHVVVFTVLKPNTRNLIELYYSHGPTKIWHVVVFTVLKPNTRNLIELYYSHGPMREGGKGSDDRIVI